MILKKDIKTLFNFIMSFGAALLPFSLQRKYLNEINKMF